jgi:hypothetical protein
MLPYFYLISYIQFLARYMTFHKHAMKTVGFHIGISRSQDGTC